ncbi:MAG TPA: hypothetical protein VF622_13940 [Segetibacter sp.]
MKNTIFYPCMLLLVLTSCQKEIDIKEKLLSLKETAAENNFVKYTIKKGEQYCDMSAMTQVEYEELKFKVKFDSTAIYATVSSENQGDINKLFGFSDNNAFHHEFSARFGWNWSRDGLTLYAYTYNNAKREFKTLGTIKIGEEQNCSIKVAGDKYIFTLNNKVETMPRTSITAKAIGYKLFPYFGGDELAPHDVSIWIKEIK